MTAEFTSPVWLAGLALIPLLYWLHRFHGAERDIRVSALFLWPHEIATDSTRRQRHRPPRVWLLRALTVTAICTALAGPSLVSTTSSPLIVWLDESVSLRTVENGRTRQADLLAALEDAVDKAGRTDVTVRSLADPARALRLTAKNERLTIGDIAATIGAWSATYLGEPRSPIAALASNHAEHWLLTDGASPGVDDWAATWPFSRVLRSGAISANTAISGLSLRRSPTDPGVLAGVIDLRNADTRPATRQISLSADNRPVGRWTVTVPPETDHRIGFELENGLPRMLEARLAPGDALAEDDTLALPTVVLQPVGYEVDARCPSTVKAALAAHPGLTAVPGDDALAISCGEAGAGAARARLVFLGAGNADAMTGPMIWQDGSGVPLLSDRVRARAVTAKGQVLASVNGQPVIVRTSRAPPVLHVGVDMATAGYAGGPASAALVSGLAERVLDRDLLDPVARAHASGPAAVAPRSTTSSATAATAAADQRVENKTLAGWLALAACLLVLIDVRVVGKNGARSWQTVGRVAIVLALGLAALNPTVSLRDPPADAIVVVDASASMPSITETWPSVAARLRRLPPGSEWTLLRFGRQPVVEHGWSPLALLPTDDDAPDAAPLDPTLSRLDHALAAGLTLARPGRPTSLLIVSDGGGFGPEAARLIDRARDAAIPVHVMRVTAGDGRRAARIDSVTTPAMTGPGTPTDVRVTIAGEIPPGAALEIRLNDLPVGRDADRLHRTATVGLTITAPAGGLHRLDARLMTVDGVVLDRADGVLHVAGPPRVLLVGKNHSPVGPMLEASGLTVTRVSPGGISGQLDTRSLAGYGLVVLDDINAAELDATATKRLAGAVRRGGIGLVALGGPHSFGAGAYRHSALEELLPVVAEATEPLPPAAVVFVVDTSGSMARPDNGPTRLAMARSAVLDTAAGLATGDTVGLVTFDIEPHAVLSIDARDDPAAALGSHWPAGAGGGTRVTPALTLAIDMLADADADQRLLVLVTDGFVDESFEPALIHRIRDRGIDVIAMPVGADAPVSALADLAAVNAGALLPVAEAAVLPALMQTEIGARRAVSIRKPGLQVIAAASAGFPGARPSDGWPVVDGYMVTRPRPAARVLLSAPNGDPLLAVMPTGAGLTAAMPAGLASEWADAWRHWEGLGPFLAGLSGWLAGQSSQPGIYARFDRRATSPRILVDLLTPDGRWDASAAPAATVRGPGGNTIALVLAMSAPGVYEAPLPVTRAGVYAVTVRVAGSSLVRGYVHRPVAEHASADAGGDVLEGWVADGLLAATGPWRFSHPADAIVTGVRLTLLTTALLLYVSLLVAERRRALALPGRAGPATVVPDDRTVQPA